MSSVFTPRFLSNRPLAHLPSFSQRVRGIGKSFDTLGPSVFTEANSLSFVPVNRAPSVDGKTSETTSVYFENGGRTETPVYLLERLSAGDLVEGPGKFSGLAPSACPPPPPVSFELTGMSAGSQG